MRLTAAPWLVLAAGCIGRGDDSGGPPGCFDGAPAVRVGTGDDTFEPLAVGDSLTMIHGPQGGWHMLGSARLDHTDQIVTIHYTIDIADGAHAGVRVSDNTLKVALVVDEECSGFYPGMYGYLSVADIASGDLDTPPELLSYTTVTLNMDVVDLAGREATASLDVVATPDPADVDDGAP